MKRKTSIIILTYNNLDYTKDCIDSILKFTKKGTYEIIVVDNLSTDGTREWLKKQKNLKVILNNKNLGFPKGCNQGIEIANSHNDILLLNNDTIVTENWLENLKICLYSDTSIGAVGAVSNHDENLQGCNFTYEDFDTMQLLAKQNNISNPKRWEQKIFLIGFCLLIKREVINQIKELDENYSPGYIEDNDLSLRITELGYKLMLCHDCFIHHYLGSSFRKDLNQFYPILYKNRKYFEEKWGFQTFAFDEIKDASLRLLENPKQVLELNCGIGTTLLKIKYQYKNVIVDGLEQDKYKRKIADHIIQVFSSFENVKEETYDYILIGDILERVKNPINFIHHIKKYLKKDGYIIGEIHNVASIESIHNLLNDHWYFERKQNHFTITDIQKIFYDEGYQNGFIFSWYKNLNEEEKEIINSLKTIKEKEYAVTYYSFRFQKK